MKILPLTDIQKSSFGTTIKSILLSLLLSQINVSRAIADEGLQIQPTTPEMPSSLSSVQNNGLPKFTPLSPSIQNAGSLTFTPTTLQQTGTNNFANVNPSGSGLNYPSCNGSCAFGILRTSPSNGFNGATGNQIEAVIGFIHSFSSPDQTNAETTRLTIEIQKYKNEYEIVLALSEKLADAIETGKYQRANIIAIVLAPKLGKTHIQLLAEIFANR